MSRPVLRFVASRCGPVLAALVRLWSRTWRVEVRGGAPLAAARARAGGMIYCFDHGRMFELAAAHADRDIAVLVSSHPDGRLAAGVVAPLGYVPIRGSRREGALSGSRGLLRHALAGGDVALAADADTDGAPPGAVRLARLTGHPIVPVAAAARPRRRVGSWDRFEIPAPGARVVIRYGAPVHLPPGAGRAAEARARRRLRVALAELHAGLEAELAGSSSPWGLAGARTERGARRA